MKTLVGSLMATAAGFGVAAWCVRESRRDERVFRDLLRGLTVGSNFEEVLQRIAERATLLIDGTAAYVERLDGDEIVAAAVYHGEGLPTSGTRGPYKGSVAQQAIETGKTIIVADVGR